MQDPNMIQHAAYLNDLEAMVAKSRSPHKNDTNHFDYGLQLRAMAVVLAVVVTIAVFPSSGVGI
ncbi:MAG: hypothetical protein QGI08_11360 [Paracoccaceae bacterium]|jgi:hypothetical protein|nr:hypothetical protein [Paracoccaceae bacterium]MDP7186310.1 hypothetical protein [Paracoccaceae bacterium]